MAKYWKIIYLHGHTDGHRSSVDPFTPTIPWPRVQIPNNQIAVLFQFLIEFWREKDEKQQKEADIGKKLKKQDRALRMKEGTPQVWSRLQIEKFRIKRRIHPVWPDLAKCRRHFGEIFHGFCNNLRGYFVLGTIFNLLWQILYATGQIFLVTNGQIVYKKSNHLITLNRSRSNYRNKLNQNLQLVITTLCIIL